MLMIFTPICPRYSLSLYIVSECIKIFITNGTTERIVRKKEFYLYPKNFHVRKILVSL